MPRLFAALLFLSLSPNLALGEGRKVSLNLCCLRFANSVRSLWLKSSPSAAPAEVTFYQGGFTEPTPVLVEDGKVVVYRKGNEGQSPWVADWSFSVPASGSEVSAILLPSPPKNFPTAPYSAFLLPPIKDFDYGAVLAVNLTPHNVRLDLGKQKLSLTPGASRAAQLESDADAYNMVPVTASIQSEGKWLTLHTTQWAYNPGYRQVSLIWMDAAAKRPEITSIRDVRPAVENLD